MKFYVGWQWVSGKESKFLEKSPEDSGYNVYAPVMYKVEATSLEVIKDFSRNIHLARQRGYGVWLTFQQFGTSPNLKENIITEIVDKALEHGVDGVNIDFEGMGERNRDKFTDFITRLYQKTSANRLVLSVDVVRPAVSLYSLCYDRRALAQVCDYLVLMAYDQHWATSPQEGSVAELSWMEDSIKRLLFDEDVPPQKLILAVPFYSRNWKIRTLPYKDSVVLRGAVNLRSGPSTQDAIIYTGTRDDVFKYLGDVSGEAVKGNNLWFKVEYQGKLGFVSAAYSDRLPEGKGHRVSSAAIGLQACLDILANYNEESQTSSFGSTRMFNVKIVYDKKAGQKLVSYEDGNGDLNKIWLEDYQSLSKRHDLIKKYNLPGLAAWSLEWMDEKQQAWNKMQG
ncbi:glycosyl hydrolase family 18 protein [Dethiobacter alkaliphilus]|uniref:glycosyl hydrolase family 18 protein n=1 Tax=Dethiobacter alkaliphilus TaxID=427926 RepID=UPI002227D45D|nr:glycosyl hydrolase family 18 protein [Dethiobacter alkaliphilus]MCW3489035.1 glycosyl hydrolase family 18 protein [Dethiobacter alkaliphilus]